LKIEHILKTNIICKDIIREFANKSLFLGVRFFRSGLLFLYIVQCWALWCSTNKKHSAES